MRIIHFASFLLFSAIQIHTAKSASMPLPPVASDDVKMARSQNAIRINLSNYGDLNLVSYYKALCALMKLGNADASAAQQQTFLKNFPDVMKEITKLKDLQASLRPEALNQILGSLQDMYLSLVMGFGHNVFNAQTGKDETIPGVFQKNDTLQKKISDNFTTLQSQKANPAQTIQSLIDLSNEKIAFTKGGALEPLENLTGQGKDIHAALDALDAFDKNKTPEGFQKILSIASNKETMNNIKKSLAQNSTAWHDLVDKISKAFGLRVYYTKPNPSAEEKESLNTQRRPFIHEYGDYNTANQNNSLPAFMQKPMSTDTSGGGSAGQPHGSAASPQANPPKGQK